MLFSSATEVDQYPAVEVLWHSKNYFIFLNRESPFAIQILVNFYFANES